MLLFGYASNMDVNKFAKTVPSAKRVCVARLPGYSFAFNKTADDLSSKSNIEKSPNATEEVWGVLIAIDDRERLNFYNPDTWTSGVKLEPVTCVDANGEIFHAEAVFALPHAVSDYVLPYDWYHKKITQLAADVGLPEAYINKIASLPFKTDPDEDRRKKRLAKLRV